MSEVEVEVEETNQYHITRSNRCTLPVGFYREGKFFREVVIDEWRAFDHEKLSSPAVKDNSSLAMSYILRRIIQSIPGILAEKSNPMIMIDERHVQEMFEVDREYILFQALALSQADEDSKEYQFLCKHCGSDNLTDVELTELKVTPHDENKPPTFNIKLKQGIKLSDRTITEGKYSYPTGGTFERIYKSKKAPMEVLMEVLGAHFIPTDVGNKDGHRLKSLTKDQMRALSLRDLKAIQNAIDSASCGVDVEVPCTCHSCGKENKVQIDMARYFL